MRPVVAVGCAYIHIHTHDYICSCSRHGAFFNYGLTHAQSAPDTDINCKLFFINIGSTVCLIAGSLYYTA